eukprot:6193822-Pleurochrysis_carterae.AAC.1
MLLDALSQRGAEGLVTVVRAGWRLAPICDEFEGVGSLKATGEGGMRRALSREGGLPVWSVGIGICRRKGRMLGRREGRASMLRRLERGWAAEGRGVSGDGRDQRVVLKQAVEGRRARTRLRARRACSSASAPSPLRRARAAEATRPSAGAAERRKSRHTAPVGMGSVTRQGMHTGTHIRARWR